MKLIRNKKITVCSTSSFSSSSRSGSKRRRKTWTSSELRNLEEALSHFEKLVSTRPLPSVIPFCRLLSAVANLNHHSAVVSLSRKLRILGLPQNPYTLNILLGSLSRLPGGTRFGFSLVGQFFKVGYAPDMVTFNSLLNGLVLEGNVGGALKLFDEMTNRGYQPNIITYESVRLNNMRAFGCEPNVVTYTTVINGLCANGHFGDAVKLFDEMSKRGCEPNVYSYTTIMNLMFTATATSEVASGMGWFIRW